MIPPEDLKNKNFSRIVRGYNPIEVDDYIKFLLTKYEQLHAENVALEKRLHIVSGKYEELANDEESIRKAVAQAKKLSDTMIQNAEKAAEEIVAKVQARCESIIEDAQIKVEAEQIQMAKLRMQAAEFKQMLLDEYTKYLKALRETVIPSPDEVTAEFPSHAFIEETAMDEILTAEIIESAVIAPSKDPELEEFKRFVRPQKKRLTREEKDALKRARKEGHFVKGQLSDEILQSTIDDEEAQDEVINEDLLAKSPEMSVEDALTGNREADFATDSQNTSSQSEDFDSIL